MSNFVNINFVHYIFGLSNAAYKKHYWVCMAIGYFYRFNKTINSWNILRKKNTKTPSFTEEEKESQRKEK
jgi:hypothetical protein